MLPCVALTLPPRPTRARFVTVRSYYWPSMATPNPNMPGCAHTSRARTTNSVRDRTDDLPGRLADCSAGDSGGAQELLQGAHETPAGIDVELGREAEHLLPHPQVDRARARVLAHEIADLAHERVGQPVERQHDLDRGIVTGRR